MAEVATRESLLEQVWELAERAVGAWALEQPRVNLLEHKKNVTFKVCTCLPSTRVLSGLEVLVDQAEDLPVLAELGHRRPHHPGRRLQQLARARADHRRALPGSEH